MTVIVLLPLKTPPTSHQKNQSGPKVRKRALGLFIKLHGIWPWNLQTELRQEEKWRYKQRREHIHAFAVLNPKNGQSGRGD